MFRKFDKCNLVAEIGAVHVGSVSRAKELIDLAALCGADYVKFQKRNPHESVPEELKNKPHPNARFAYGPTYLSHRLALELNLEQHAELKEYCENRNIDYSVSVWDITSTKEMITLKPHYIKIPSACNMRWDMLNILTNEYDGDIHISTGMMTIEDRSLLFNKIIELKIESRTVLYHCTSEYPCPFERLHLLELDRLSWGPSREIGFSNHGYGIASDIVSYMLGARWIERHFIDDRTFPHTDASVSLEPQGLSRLARDLKAIQKTLTYKETLSNEELEQKKKLRVTNDQSFSV